MRKIECLTASQQAKLNEFTEQWTKIGLCTDATNRPTAERGIIESYRIANLPAPHIVWCGSPLSMAVTRATVQNAKTSVVRDSVGASVRASVRASVGDSVYGQHDAHWLGFYDYFREVLGLRDQTQKAQGLTMVARNAGWWLPHERICWVSERHSVVKQDAAYRLHCEDGPAVRYPDGWSLYYWHGVVVPEAIIERPESITPQSIQGEHNAEVRRVMLTKYGFARYIDDVGAVEIDRDRDTKGERVLYSLRDEMGEVKMIRLQNSTPERDGSDSKRYTFRVPPDVTSCRAAVAYMYGVDVDRYNVAVES